MGEPVDSRLILRVAQKLLIVVALLWVMYVFVASLSTDEGEEALTAVVVKLDEIPPGAVRIVEWKGRKVLVLHRTPVMLSEINVLEQELVNPRSRFSNQPGAADKAHRALRPNYFVALAYGTDIDCELEFVPYRAQPTQRWRGGFKDRCRGSRYDFAGRAFKNQPARRNLVVPEHYYASATELVIGVSGRP